MKFSYEGWLQNSSCQSGIFMIGLAFGLTRLACSQSSSIGLLESGSLCLVVDLGIRRDHHLVLSGRPQLPSCGFVLISGVLISLESCVALESCRMHPCHSL